MKELETDYTNFEEEINSLIKLKLWDILTKYLDNYEVHIQKLHNIQGTNK